MNQKSVTRRTPHCDSIRHFLCFESCQRVISRQEQRVRVFEHKIPFAKDPPPVRQSYPSPTVNFGSGSQCSSHYLKAHGFLGTPGSSATRRILHFTNSFPAVRGNFPAQDADVGTPACCLARRCVSHRRNSQWQRRSGVRARTGHDDCNHMETLALPMLQPTLVIQVTE